MYAGRKGAAGLLLAATFAVAAAHNVRWPRSRPARLYRPNMGPARLIEHVMMYEEQWTDVLQEPVKQLDKLPHEKRLFAAAAPDSVGGSGDDDGGPKADAAVQNVREIVATVVTNYGGIGSLVEYGAMAVRRALSCYTFRQVLFQTTCIALMMVKNADPIVVLTTANALKKNAAAYIDVLAVESDDDLSALLHVYWEAVDVTQYDSVQYLKGRSYPEPWVNAVKSLSLKVNDYLYDECQLFTSDNEEYFRRIGIRQKTPLFGDPDLDLIVKIDSLVDVTREHVERMGQYAKKLGIVTMPVRQWSSLFFDNNSIPIESDLKKASSIVRADLTTSEAHESRL